jgi:hypothetical protein
LRIGVMQVESHAAKAGNAMAADSNSAAAASVEILRLITEAPESR